MKAIIQSNNLSTDWEKKKKQLSGGNIQRISQISKEMATQLNGDVAWDTRQEYWV